MRPTKYVAFGLVGLHIESGYLVYTRVGHTKGQCGRDRLRYVVCHPLLVGVCVAERFAQYMPPTT